MQYFKLKKYLCLKGRRMLVSAQSEIRNPHSEIQKNNWLILVNDPIYL
jgi:hypothetical protein